MHMSASGVAFANINWAARKNLLERDLRQKKEEPNVDENDVHDLENELAQHLPSKEQGSICDDEERLNDYHSNERPRNLKYEQSISCNNVEQ